jgi:hypothetical protein
MGVKYFCDRCGKEFNSKGLVIPRYARDDIGVSWWSVEEGLLCEECAEKFNKVKDRLEYAEDFFNMTDYDIALTEYDFKVGDKVITSTDEVGIIESICDCESCKARGFCEPTVKLDGCDNRIYITDFARNNGFKMFYQIGKYKFGNIDKESVERSIEYENNRIKEASKRLEEYEKQLRRLKRLESGEKDEEESSSEEDSWLVDLLDWSLY